MRVRWPRTSRRYLAAAVVLAIVTGGLLHRQLSRLAAAAEAADPGATATVVAATDVERGEALRPSQLSSVLLPQVYVPPGAITTVNEAAGRVALSDLAAGEVVTATRLARVRAGPVASLVPEGLRAFAVPTSLPVGAVVPGDRVDVLATFGTGQPYTETVVEGVEVLFVLASGGGGEATEGDLSLDLAAAGVSEPVTLVLLVAPQQQERLAFARAFADLAVTIVPPADGWSP